ncbi:MAG: hypothetical protein ABH828_04605 [archaeon]
MKSAIKQPSKGKSLIGKEVIIGILSIALGGYNLLYGFGFVKWEIQSPQIVGNILLVLGGFFLIIQAFRLIRHEYHIKSLF